MLHHLNERDVVIVSKYLKGKGKKQEVFIRRMLSLGGSLISRSLFGLTFRDTQAGAKFFKRHVWEDVRNRYTCTGFEWDIEFLYRVRKFKFRVAEIYMPFKMEKFSTFRLKYLPGMVKRLLKLRILS